ncbi:hypothetical protein fHeYen901_16 [Yersinia phage fHe-Yen9-01]|uniref:Uncharacterized protein n=1 Tax=Yersinia phage fHe-Yen9-01 TaxID=1965363 RepID=A0A1V0DXB1_9CAUD|nr:hypothetical protein KNT60_gp015 [Yersinia phage fHe-Yen9-01]ARB05789.1 hypothetical protein fHeYen901_16 [Yersinia phage fHe-Yen9-01]
MSIVKVGQKYQLVDPVGFEEHSVHNKTLRKMIAKHGNIITVKEVTSQDGIQHTEEFSSATTIATGHELILFFKLITLDEEIHDENECAEDSTEYVKVTRKVEINKTITDANEASKLISLLKSEFGL